jgi:hypothetical protein
VATALAACAWVTAAGANTPDAGWPGDAGWSGDAGADGGVPAAAVEEPPALQARRADGLAVVVEELPGTAVSVRVVVNLHRAAMTQPTPGAARVVAGAILSSGEPGRVLREGGARCDATVVDNSLVLEVDTTADAWREHLGALVRAVSRPNLDSSGLGLSVNRLVPFGVSRSLEAVHLSLGERLVARDPSLVTLGPQPPEVDLDTAVWHLEQAFASDRMALVVVGPVKAAQVDAVVEQEFLVPMGPPEGLAPEPPAAGGVEEEVTGASPYHLAWGQRARGIASADAVVLAAYLRQRLEEDEPQAADCDVRYVPSASEPTVLALCVGVQGVALDVRAALDRVMDPRVVAPAPPASLQVARRVALARLVADHAGSARLADRVASWAAAKREGGVALERAVAATTEPALQAALTDLLAPQRAIRIKRSPPTK